MIPPFLFSRCGTAVPLVLLSSICHTRVNSFSTSKINFFTGFIPSKNAFPSIWCVAGPTAASAPRLSCSNFGDNPLTKPRSSFPPTFSSVPSSSPTRRKMSSTDSVDIAQKLTGYLNAVDAAALDAELMSTPGFSLEQLMELAGLAVAEAIYDVVFGASTENNDGSNVPAKILFVCGPGNNGGDGLVAARHLALWGFQCEVIYPKRSTKTHFINLVQQLEDVEVPIKDTMPSIEDAGGYDVIVDSIFGFSFRGGSPREPFKTALDVIKEVQSQGSQPVTVVSVDVPSGWDVDRGDIGESGFAPDVLVSLTVPKLSSKSYYGRHFIGGRFLPPKLAEKYGINMPPYPGTRQVMELTEQSVLNMNEGGADDKWEAEYAKYLAHKERGLNSEVSDTNDEEDNTISDNPEGAPVRNARDTEEWAVQYQEYLREKEKGSEPK